MPGLLLRTPWSSVPVLLLLRDDGVAPPQLLLLPLLVRDHVGGGGCCCRRPIVVDGSVKRPPQLLLLLPRVLTGRRRVIVFVVVMRKRHHPPLPVPTLASQQTHRFFIFFRLCVEGLPHHRDGDIVGAALHHRGPRENPRNPRDVFHGPEGLDNFPGFDDVPHPVRRDQDGVVST